MIKNRERLNRRLMLMQLELDGLATVASMRKVIRDQLLTRGGFGGPRYLVDDKDVLSSLRRY